MQESEKTLFRKQFRVDIYGNIPYEVWRDLIVMQLSINDIMIVRCVSKSLRKLIKIIGVHYRKIARSLRIKSEIPLALEYLCKSIKCANVDSLFDFAYAHHFGGWEVTPDRARSIQLSTIAAENGCDIAIKYLIRFSSDILKWRSRILNTRDPLLLAYCYKNGIFHNQNIELAFKYCKQSADDGNEYAQYLLARLYRYGIGTEVNFGKEKEYLLNSANQGFYPAQIQLKNSKYYPDDADLWSERCDWIILCDRQRGDNFALYHKDKL